MTESQYPILSTSINRHEDYLTPTNYKRLLKPYMFNGLDDLSIFQDFLEDLNHLNISTSNNLKNILELGGGPGRSLNAFLQHASAEKINLLDLSPQMLEESRQRFKNYENINFIESDTLTYLSISRDRYDLIFSLWSISHSVHQSLIFSNDFNQARLRAKSAIRKMVTDMMKDNSAFFMIHVDSKSEEQTILFKQWSKLFPIFQDESIQTPSKILFDEVFNELRDESVVKFETTHLEGDPIIYNSFNELLDIFLNFHLESYFNQRANSKLIIKEIEEYVEQFKRKDGSYAIRPGCFLYKVIKQPAVTPQTHH